MKNIIRCINCESQGTIQNLAELLPSGLLAIQRHYRQEYGKDYTVVGGNDFQLICGNCGDVGYLKQPVSVLIVGTYGTNITI